MIENNTALVPADHYMHAGRGHDTTDNSMAVECMCILLYMRQMRALKLKIPQHLNAMA